MNSSQFFAKSGCFNADVEMDAACRDGRSLSIGISTRAYIKLDMYEINVGRLTSLRIGDLGGIEE